MSDDFFGEAGDPEGDRKITVVWPVHATNGIEIELFEAMHIAETNEDSRAPMVFVDDDAEGDWNKEDYASYGPITASDAITLRDIIYGEVQLRFRRQLIIARELGPDATLQLYLVACELENLDPILKGK
jgi:hypothetical protein